MVSVKLPAGVVPAVVVTVNVELPDPLIEDGTNDADTPAGKPVVESAMLPEYPLSAVVETVYVVESPAFTVLLGGVAPIEKSG